MHVRLKTVPLSNVVKANTRTTRGTTGTSMLDDD